MGPPTDAPVNLLILHPDDFREPGLAALTGRRLEHLRSVHRAEVGDTVKVGLLGGSLGTGRLTRLDAEAAELRVELATPPPPKQPLTLVLALPRPKVLNRVLAAATSLGVHHIVLMNAWKVEKAYWKSPRLSEENLLEQRILGLEQAVDTVLPELRLARFFRRFVEDELPALSEGTLRLVAHPGPHPPCPREVQGPVTLVVGPEGGFLPEEVELLVKTGFAPVDLGSRILRVETAVAALMGRLF